MLITILDVECTFCKNNKTGRTDNTPYNGNNKLICVGYKAYDPTNKDIWERDCLWFNHKSSTFREHYNPSNSRLALQDVLDDTTLLVGHNLKFDIQWLLECGFKYDGPLYDTMVGEYILARGLDWGLSLKDSCARHGLTAKRIDLIDEYLKNDIPWDEIPPEIMEEYNLGDIESTHELLLKQCIEYEKEENRGLKPTVEMTNEYTWCLIDMERNGLAIDLERLEKVEVDYKEQLDKHKGILSEITKIVMGDRPYNLSSPEQLSQVIYSRKVKDKVKWAAIFNIGVNEYGKPNRRPHYSDAEFRRLINELTEPIYRTTAVQCKECEGRGHYFKLRVDGSNFKRATTCRWCSGTGVVYESSTKRAGLGLHPNDTEQVTANGFSTSKDDLEALKLIATKEISKQFLESQIISNRIESYLNTFIEGIRNNTRENGILHTQLLQCVTDTGRLSSRGPNMHNQPRGGTFPVRAAIKSRFEGGCLGSFDFKGLEYRVAIDLSRDSVGKNDILNGVDAHLFTSEHTGLNRQDSKPHTFAPLYGADPNGKTPAIARYYVAFMDKHKGVKDWHGRLQDEAIQTKRIRLPSGREFAFPNARRTRTGGSTGATRIKNYPVQGFATADIVPIAGIKLRQRLREMGSKSLVVLVIHDEFLLDIFPGEEEVVTQIAFECMNEVHKEVKRRYGYDLWVPIEAEGKIGLNWLEMEKVYVH